MFGNFNEYFDYFHLLAFNSFDEIKWLNSEHLTKRRFCSEYFNHKMQKF